MTTDGTHPDAAATPRKYPAVGSAEAGAPRSSLDLLSLPYPFSQVGLLTASQLAKLGEFAVGFCALLAYQLPDTDVSWVLAARDETGTPLTVTGVGRLAWVKEGMPACCVCRSSASRQSPTTCPAASGPGRRARLS